MLILTVYVSDAADDLEKWDTFNYLGRMLSFDDRGWPVVTRNPYKVCSKWGWLSCLICKKGG